MGGNETAADDFAWKQNRNSGMAAAGWPCNDESPQVEDDAISELRKILPDLSPALIQRIVLGSADRLERAPGDEETTSEAPVGEEFPFCPPQQRSCSDWWTSDGGPPWLRRGTNGLMTHNDEPPLPPLLRMLASAMRTAAE
ncbi:MULTISPECIES: hypothetical protein [Actinophytocola]|uniref:hypothetical protein n=1 Tax=Actinophytocola sp. TaxID=1872138 RepID=UPI003D6C446A